MSSAPCQALYLPSADAKWEVEVREILKNYEFSCVGAWNGFHVYISLKLKSFFSFKKRYSMTNLGLVSYNKRFLYAVVGAPGSAHNARLLKETSIFHRSLKRDVLPDRIINLGDFGYMPLVTVGDCAFLQFSWNKENTRGKQHRYSNERFCGARIVTGNAYGILKGRWQNRILPI